MYKLGGNKNSHQSCCTLIGTFVAVGRFHARDKCGARGDWRTLLISSAGSGQAEPHQLLDVARERGQRVSRDEESRDVEEVRENAVLRCCRAQVVIAGRTPRPDFDAKHTVHHESVAMAPLSQQIVDVEQRLQQSVGGL